MIKRLLAEQIVQKLGYKKVVVLKGSRQVGKTTLLNQITSQLDIEIEYFNGDEPDDRALLSNTTSTELRRILGNNKLMIVDEAQRIKNIGLTLKLIIDQLQDIQIIITGSSALELANEINEPLTGRKWEFQIFPMSVEEMINHGSLREEKRLLNHRLVYGFYPEVVTNPGEEKGILRSLSNSLLYKDIFSLENIKKPLALEKLVQSLAFQVGSEVSISELSQQANIDFHTTERYLDLLEKTYIVFNLSALSRNLRNEIKKSRKYYFYDNGIRNAAINQFQSMEMRNDKGALWENFLVSERLKFLQQHKIYCNQYFWRTHAQQEIDYLEENDGFFNAYEFKYSPKKKVKFSKSFINAYQTKEIMVVNSDNYLEFVT